MSLGVCFRNLPLIGKYQGNFSSDRRNLQWKMQGTEYLPVKKCLQVHFSAFGSLWQAAIKLELIYPSKLVIIILLKIHLMSDYMWV